jgi:hypothetical protein
MDISAFVGYVFIDVLFYALKRRCRTGQKLNNVLTMFEKSVFWRGKYVSGLNAFVQGIVVGARCTGLSVSRAATLLCFSCSTFLHVY